MNELLIVTVVLLLIIIVLGIFAIIKFQPKNNNQNINNMNVESKIMEIDAFIKNKEGQLETILNNIKDNDEESKKEFSKKIKEFQQILVGNIQAQGDVGEDMLQKILELSNIKFEKQPRRHDEDEKTFKPDYLVTLPHDRKIIIDCKTTLDHWDKYVNAQTKDQKNLSLSKHIDAVKDHIDKLSKKHYQKLEDDTVNTVVMFSTNELSIHAIGSHNTSKILLHAFNKNITICGPSQLYFLLKIVEKQWANEKQKKNIKDVANIGKAMFEKTEALYFLVNKVITSFNGITSSLKTLKNKLEGPKSLKKDAIKMRELGNLIVSKPDIPLIKNISGEENEENNEDQNKEKYN